MSFEVSWFAALCDDDYEFLGVPEGKLVTEAGLHSPHWHRLYAIIIQAVTVTK